MEREPPESETSRIVFSSADERAVFAVGDDCVLARSPIKRDRSFASQNVSADLAVNGVFATVVSEIVFSAVVISIGYIWIVVSSCASCVPDLAFKFCHDLLVFGKDQAFFCLCDSLMNCCYHLLLSCEDVNPLPSSPGVSHLHLVEFLGGGKILRLE